MTLDLIVGEPVARDDGRFYVPVSRAEPLEGVPSQIVFRVASDAFPTLEDACAYAKMVASAINWSA